MADFSFEQDTRVFQNRDALTEQYTPDELVGRDEELTEFHAALQPVINGENPSNIFIYGKSGVGKTAATRFLLDRLERDVRDVPDVDLTTIDVNCDGLNTSYQTAVELVNRMRDAGKEMSTTGYPQSAVYNALWDELENRQGTVIVVLDEVDHINDDSILYQLSRARDNGVIDDVDLGVIGISNDLSFRENLSSKVRSSLCEREVNFSAYNATELQEVLRQRETVAFHENTLADEVVPLCAAYGARDSGDARQALDLLLMAGDLARQDDAEHVTEQHVRRAKNRLKKNQVEEGISTLSPHGQYALYALVVLEERDETPARTRDVVPVYQDVCRQQGDDPVSLRSVRDHLASLAQLGIIERTETNRGRDGGKFTEQQLNHDADIVRAGVSELLELDMDVL
ncbi:AAA family ATPase [Halorubellus sp. JP-L1]|uniref:orc1/cdc6 family replication initiation protein n=1 Tax=Halorubellus sp. JP-L1 TaxID=2715753 RepID=UPI00140BD3DD|nr:orc1/cdc6 family replication initiation protein [Halorubellus sp. JP-L1]NHN42757.1 AAA family ATPase [Halorubellus sp. JP-L1]